MADFERMTFLEMTNIDSRIDGVSINSVEDFVDSDSQTGQIADAEGDLVIDFAVITNIMDIDDTEDLLYAVVVVDMEQFS